jgi:RNA polymerase sigma-70 factor (ECF subfamily)
VLAREARAELDRDMRRLADGDRRAFEPVFHRLWPLVREFAARHLAPADAEDAAQRALLKLFERAGTYDPERDALAWAIGITAWEVRTTRRQAWRRRDNVDAIDESLAGDAADPEELAIAADLARALGRSLSALAPADAEALLRDATGDRTTGAAFRKRLQRARERLRAAWRRHHD